MTMIIINNKKIRFKKDNLPFLIVKQGLVNK